MTYRDAIDIDAPPNRVWAVLTDVERWPEWSPTMTTVTRIETGMFRTGSNTRIKQPKLPESIWRATSLTPQASFTWTSRSRGVTTEAKHVLVPLGEGTRAENHVRQTEPLAWLAKLLFGRLTRRYIELESQGLKKRCEAR